MAADQSVVTEYGYDDEGHITSETRNTLTAPPTVERVQPSFVRKDAQRELTITGQNLRGATITTDATGIGIVSVIPGDSPRVVLSLPGTVTNGIHSLNISTPLGSTTANFEVREPLPALLAQPLPLEVVVGGSTQLRLSLGSVADKQVSLSVAVEPEGSISLEHDPLSLSPGGTVFPTVTITGVTAGQTTLRFSAEEFPDLVLNVQVVPATGLQLPTNAQGESYLADSAQLGVMNGQPAVPAAKEFAAVASFKIVLMNGSAPGHLLDEIEPVSLESTEVKVVNGPAPGHLLDEVVQVSLAGTEVKVMNGSAPGHLLPGRQAVWVPGSEVGVSNGTTPEYLER